MVSFGRSTGDTGVTRREFITLLGGAAAAWSLSLHAADQRHIVILHSGFPNRTPIDRLFNALNERGYGAANIELLGGEGDPDRLKTLIAQTPSSSGYTSWAFWGCPRGSLPADLRA